MEQFSKRSVEGVHTRITTPLTISELELDRPGPAKSSCGSKRPGSATPTCPSSTARDHGRCPCCSATRRADASKWREHGVHSTTVGDRVVMSVLPRWEECARCQTDGRRPCGPGSTATAPVNLDGGRRLTSPPNGYARTPPSRRLRLRDARRGRQHSLVPVDDDVPPTVAAMLGCAVLTGGGALVNAVRRRPGDRHRGRSRRRRHGMRAHRRREGEIRSSAWTRLPTKLDQPAHAAPPR